MTSPSAPADLDAQIKSGFDLARYTLVDMNVPARSDVPLTFNVRLGTRSVTLVVAPYSMRGDSFQVMTVGADNIPHAVEAPPICTFRGDVENDPGSEVRAALIRGGLEAVIRLSDGTTWAIQPIAWKIGGTAATAHVVYSEHDVLAPAGYRCGVPDAAPNAKTNLLRPVGGTPAPRNTGDKIADIACDADLQYYQSLGSNVANVVNDIESIMNAVEGIYEFNTDIAYEETVIMVRTAAPDVFPSTDPGTLLGQFQTYWNNNHGAIRRDMAHLFTGKDIASASGGVIGISYLGTVCTNSQSYSLVQSRYTTNLTLRRSLSAHELGHTWNAQHCNNSGDCNIMCSCNGCGAGSGCTGIFTSFGNTEVGQITAFRNTRGCLVTEPAPVVAPFFDDFSAAAIDVNKWVYNFGAALSTAAVSPPSSPRTLALNALNANANTDDEIRTHFIQLVGVTNPTLTYYVEARGVPSGKQMFVDVWTSNLRWVTVNTITSDGVDDTAFTQYTHSLTSVSGAVHNEFRVRFRVDVDSTSQNFFIDNVYVGAPQAPASGACCLAGGGCNSLTQAGCLAAGGTYQGDGSVCGTANCPTAPGACCLQAGGCITVANEILCISSGGAWQGAGSTCGAANCPPPPGACCLPDGSCQDVADAAACTSLGGVFQGAGAACDSANCPPPSGACCLPNGTCVTAANAAACTTQGGVFNGAGTTCGSINCPQPSGACCLPNGSCVSTADAAACTAQGGTFNGAGTTCGAINCPQPTGACCLPSGSCVVADAAGCAAQSGTFHGAGSVCGQVTCPQPCRCDFDHSGGISSADFFGFLTAFFNVDVSADFDQNGAVNSADFFGFLTCFFSGC